MTTYRVTCTGLTALLMHSNNVTWEDQMAAWQKSNKQPKGATKKKATKAEKIAEPESDDEHAEEITPASKAGDDRTPAFRWIGSLWHDGAHIGITKDAITKALMRGGANVPYEKKLTYKSLSVSGMCVNEPNAPLLVRGKQIPMALIEPLKEEPLFANQVKAVRKMGFDLDVRRATVGMSQHVRVRPRFDVWSFEYTINVWNSVITEPKLKEIVAFAAEQGLGDWRPSAPKSPGPYGRYEAKLRKV